MRRLRYAGFAEEATYAVDPPPAAVFDVDITQAGLDSPSDPQLVYGGGLSRNARTHRPGFYQPGGNVAYAFDIRTIGWLLRWCLGGYVFTGLGGAGGLNLHEIHGSEDAELPSFCTRLGKDIFEHVFSGCVIGQLQIQTSNEFVMATASLVAARDTKAALREITDLALPDEYPLAFHEVTMGLAGDAEAWTKVRNLQLTIANNPGGDAGRTIGSRFARRQVMGERTVTAQLGLIYGDTDQLERFWGDAAGPGPGGAVEYPAHIDFDAGPDGHLRIDLPRGIHTQVQQQPSGRDEITQQVNTRAFIDTVTLDDGVTDVTADLLATLSNDQAEMGP